MTVVAVNTLWYAQFTVNKLYNCVPCKKKKKQRKKIICSHLAVISFFCLLYFMVVLQFVIYKSVICIEFIISLIIYS